MKKKMYVGLSMVLLLQGSLAHSEEAAITIEGLVPSTEATGPAASETSEATAWNGGAQTSVDSSITMNPVSVTVVGVGALVIFAIVAHEFGKQHHEAVGMYQTAAEEIENSRANELVDPLANASDNLKAVFEIEKKAIAQRIGDAVTFTNEQILEAIMKDKENLVREMTNSK